MRLGDDDAEQPHVGEALPQRAIIGLGPVDDRAHRGGRAVLVEEAAHLVAQLDLFGGEFEVHPAPPMICSPAPALRLPWEKGGGNYQSRINL